MKYKTDLAFTWTNRLSEYSWLLANLLISNEEVALESFLRKILQEASNPPETNSAAAAPNTHARLAVYDNMTTAPRVVDLDAQNLVEFIGLLSARTYQLSQERGGNIPFTVIKEITENLIHAFFADVVISVMADGNTILVSDGGPGITDKEKAVQPGYSTSTNTMKQFIRGVGSGLPIASESMAFLGGFVRIDDNLGRGTVVTIGLPAPDQQPAHPQPSSNRHNSLSLRQKKVLSLILEYGTAGPSLLASELGTSLSTAYREVAKLETIGLLVSDGGGKRTLSAAGVARLKALGGSH